jgi:queuosine precursor transporter
MAESDERLLHVPIVALVRIRSALLLGTLFVALVLLANWLAARYVVHVPLTPYAAPAGVFCIGGVLVLRDWLQQLVGLAWTMPLVYAAGLASWGIGDLAGWTSLEKIAIASVVAFTVSETIEALVFTPLRRRSLSLGVALSATVGNAIDSYIFLTLAFSSTAFFWGQFWGKSEAIAAGVALTLARRRLAPVPAV